MGIVPGWVLFALAGVAVAPHAERARSQVTYTVRVVNADGVGWREGVYGSLKPVTRQGSATVWTLPRQAMTGLLADLTKGPRAGVVEAPRVTALSGAPATIQCRTSRPVVTQVAWTGAGDDAAEKLRVGWHTTMVGRKLDQGILVQLVFEDTVVRAVHHVNVARAELACTAKAAGTATRVLASSSSNIAKHDDGDGCPAVKACCGTSDTASDKVAIEVPEIDSQEIVGEWLVPRGEVLLVSFGVHTVADKDGKAVVSERLAFVEADDATEMTRGLPPMHMPVIKPIHPMATAPAPKLALPSPAMPSRSIPQGVHADGTPADLPPLPADETEASESSESSEPMPSPQTKKTPVPKPAADSGTAKAEFSLPKAATMFMPSFTLPTGPNGFQFLLPIKPLAIKLPFGQRLEFELFGKIVPESETH